MEQRSLRLGDTVDDYCPRERRITNHVIVALVGNVIRQTRCATCDADHEYKEARLPRKKGKAGESGDAPLGVLVAPKPAAVPPRSPDPDPPAVQASAEPAEAADPPAATPDVMAEPPGSSDEVMPDGWLAHRPLIRATLPKTEGEVPPPRAIPEFTMHQRQGRGFGGRPFRPSGFSGHQGNGNPGPRRDGQEPDGNRVARPGKSRHRRRHRRPR
jgi:hypothetical protein